MSLDRGLFKPLSNVTYITHVLCLTLAHIKSSVCLHSLHQCFYISVSLCVVSGVVSPMSLSHVLGLFCALISSSSQVHSLDFAVLFPTHPRVTPSVPCDLHTLVCPIAQCHPSSGSMSQNCILVFLFPHSTSHLFKSWAQCPHSPLSLCPGPVLKALHSRYRQWSGRPRWPGWQRQ